MDFLVENYLQFFADEFVFELQFFASFDASTFFVLEVFDFASLDASTFFVLALLTFLVEDLPTLEFLPNIVFTS